MGALEPGRIERGFEPGQALAEQSDAPAAVNADIVRVTLDPLDLADWHHQLPATFGNHQLLEISRRWFRNGFQ